MFHIDQLTGKDNGSVSFRFRSNNWEMCGIRREYVIGHETEFVTNTT